MVTLLTGAGFAALKFVLIGELAFEYSPTEPLPFAWMDHVVRNAVAHDTLDEAVSQGLAAILTLGVLIGYLLNAPLAGAWRVGRLFFISCAGVAAGALITAWVNGWLIAALIGIAYGAACAARGKAIPLLARATGRPNTLVSGAVNAALVVGLLAGTVLGTMLRDHMDDWLLALGADVSHHQPRIVNHSLLFAFMALATMLSLMVKPPEPRSTPFVQGMRELLDGTVRMFGKHWALLVGGGLAWGIASAASLAVYIDAVGRLNLHPTNASFMAVFAASGAIVGNLVSHYFTRRRHVMLSLLGLGLCIALYPHVVIDQRTASMMMVLVGAFFAAPANVLDARLLSLAGAAGLAGRGSTVMSLVHNVFIFLVGTGLAVPLFLGAMTPTDQFYFLAAVAVITIVVAGRARLRDSPVTTVLPVEAAAGTGIAD
jgi:MFS family permease